ncbi:MAG: insulinase family protein [Phycisphaerae bacterium]|nr:insulinase family protein [Phycisphaerae bacterium]
MQFQQTTLSNGLCVVAEVNPTAKSLAAGFFVRTGSRDETPEVAGVSHFLEHMVFKGTDRRTALDVNLEFDRMGAQYNAFTGEETTVYFAAVLPEFQAACLDLLCDILRPSLRQEDFDVEKGVIQEEIAMYDDLPHFRLHETIMSRHFDSHPLGNAILGTKQSVAAMKRDDMRAYFDRRYSPGNVTLVGVGNLDFDAFASQAEALCSSWKPFQADRSREPCDGTKTHDSIVDEKLSRQNLGLMSPAPSYQDEQCFAAQVLSTVLGDSTGSRLFYALIETALADEAHTAYSGMDGVGVFYTFASTAPEAAGRVLDIIRREFKKFLDEGPTDAELQAAKNKIASQATLKGEQPMGRLVSVGFDWMYRGRYEPLAQQIERIFAVTGEQVLQLARRYDIASATTLSLGPTAVTG